VWVHMLALSFAHEDSHAVYLFISSQNELRTEEEITDKLNKNSSCTNDNAATFLVTNYDENEQADWFLINT
jgi:hypothetical protein